MNDEPDVASIAAGLGYAAAVPARSLRKSWCLGASLLATLAVPRLARAEAPLPAHAPAGTGQQALSVSSTKSGDIVAASCAQSPCTQNPVGLDVPVGLRGRVRAEVVNLGAGRRAIVLVATDGTSSYRAVLAAPLVPGAPKVLFAGLVGAIQGQEGTRSGPMVQVSEAAADGTRRVLVGEQQEGISICGRPTILAPRLLSPDDLELKAAKVQRLSVAERDVATTVQATRLPDDEPSRAASSVLSAIAASSAIGAPQALTDGDPESTWSENVGGDGKGEFVILHAPPELSISGLELLVRPRARQIEGGAAPERLFIAGPRDVIEVTLPDDAWQSPGARYRIPLEPALQGGCLAVVLDTSFDRSKSAKVTLAELSVVSEFTESELPALVAALAGGGQRAEAARTLLVAGGPAAFAAVARAFDGLDEGGKRVALAVMDQAPCEASAPVYVSALVGKIDAQVRHAQNRLRRCSAAGGAALAAALAKVDKTDKRLMPLLVNQLTLTDPARAVQAFLPLMDEKTVARRRLLRTALAHAARVDGAAATVRAALANASTPPVALIDLLRALGDQAPRFQPEAAQALSRLTQGSLELRARYLLLGPTAVLSQISADADAAFRKSLASDPSPHVRASALSLVRAPVKFRAELLVALEDPEMRVREAAVRALSSREAAFASAALGKRLQDDAWPLVRAASADALSQHPASADLDQLLIQALTDESSLVRSRSIRALGERQVTDAAEQLRDRLIDDGEWPEVRAEAARALGTLCDADSAEILAAFAKKLADPMASPDAQLIATGAVMSLGRLAPPDLARALAPLSDRKAPPQARRAAATALSARRTCRAPTASKR